MPQFPNTPEALLGRNDSKNPATTCKGITSSGRPCRRALASPGSSPSACRQLNVSALNGVVALVREDGEIQEADFYCWQHKDQAEQRVQRENRANGKGRRVKRRSTELYPLQERSSIETLVQRLGIDAASDSHSKEPRRPLNATFNPKPPRRTDTSDFAAAQRPPQAPYAEKYDFVLPAGRQSQSRKKSFWTSLCCITSDNDDYVEIVRHKKRVGQVPPPDMSSVRPAESRISSIGAATPTSRPLRVSAPVRKPTTTQTARPAPEQRRSSNSQTNKLLSLIPQHLSPQTTSILFSELTKPISPYDEEGYIYIFWLTPHSNLAPPESTARSLLSPGRPQHERRISDVMTEYSFDGSDAADVNTRSFDVNARAGKKTIMLKIGRTGNITRRMNEWQRQCGYALNLVRWYPHIPSTTTLSPQREQLYPDLSRPPTGRRQSDAVRKVPCVKRVERLIHLELAEKQVKRQCGACGKEHREWFEVEASQAGVKVVDETVRRWVGWGERQAGVLES